MTDRNDAPENDEREPLPRIPDYDAGDVDDDVHVPSISEPSGHAGRESGEGVKPIKYRQGPPANGETGRSNAHAHAHDDGCGCGSACGCSDGGEKVATDGGGTAANVSPDGELGDIEFTKPSEGMSQDIEGEGEPDKRVGVPEGVDLSTPGYSIRREMSDIEEPADKTWFMELDTAVIDADRCIQCGTCVAACPSDSIGIGDDGLPELVKMCTGCSLCWDFCPRGGMRYERQWKITGGEDNVKGAGDPITEFSAKVEDDWRENAQDGGVVTSILSHLLEAGEIDGAVIATESEDEAWKAESFVATTHEELVENAGSFYNQTMALGNLDLDEWSHKLPDKPTEEMSLALVGTPCEIEGIRALQDFEWDYQSQNDGVRAIDYTIALMCTKNFNYQRLIGEQLEEKRDIDPEDIGKLDVIDGKFRVYDNDKKMILEEDIQEFHGAALKGCDECADFTGFCSDVTVGSVGSSDEYSSVIIRTETGMEAWEMTEDDLDYHDLEDKGAIGGLQNWDKKKAFESLKRPFDPDAPRFIDYEDHAKAYGTTLRPHETDH